MLPATDHYLRYAECFTKITALLHESCHTEFHDFTLTIKVSCLIVHYCRIFPCSENYDITPVTSDADLNQTQDRASRCLFSRIRNFFKYMALKRHIKKNTLWKMLILVYRQSL